MTMSVVLPILVFRIVIENAQINLNNDIKNEEEEINSGKFKN